MSRRLRFFLFTISSLFLLHSGSAQDSSAITGWRVETNKTGEGTFTLNFLVTVKDGWQLYAPEQVFEGAMMAELKFRDSSIVPSGPFVSNGDAKTIESPYFGPGTKVYEGGTNWVIPIRIAGNIPRSLLGTLNYSYGRGEEFFTGQYEFQAELEGGIVAGTRIKIPSIDINNPASPCGDEGTKNKSMLTIFLLGIIGGLIALITPCVFPMIPVTVTFFTKKSGDRKKGITNAALYGFFIFLIYVLITIPFHIASKTISPEIFNNISTNVTLNIIFFAVFILFALSFFGLFEIGLPSSLANKADSKSGLGNMAGIFFMAGTLSIVSFSCTGPILGTLLTNVVVDGAWPLTAGAAGFGLALGLPFALFAMFPNWLQSLPRSGGWMTDVKVVLGFLELALAVKFLSNADLVKQWGLLKREVFIGLWILIGILTVLYLAGKLRISNSSPVSKFSFTRIAFIVLFGAFTIYLLPGLTNSESASLRLISGFPPPRTYSLYSQENNRNKIIEPIHNDYDSALVLARKENKPVLIDFTGWACVNCRRMEDKVWPDRLVDSLMRKEFIVVSLYVDERRRLPLTDQIVYKNSAGTEKQIITVGDKWSAFQVENFGATSQPQYVILSPDEKVLTRSKYYTPDADEFAEWLKCGIKSFKERKLQAASY